MASQRSRNSSIEELGHGGTKQRALSEAKVLLQTVGYNGFSFQDIADAVGVQKPSLYTHFKSKESLGQDLLEDYRRTFLSWAETVEELDGPSKIKMFFDIYLRFSKQGFRYCPLSSLVGELNSIPASMKKKLQSLFLLQISWIERVVTQGQRECSIRRDISCEELAQFVISQSAGAQYLARISGNSEVIKSIKSLTLEFLSPTPSGLRLRARQKK